MIQGVSDIVNEFFRRHYPPDHATAWELRYGVGSYWRRYTGSAPGRPTIFPEMVCADGFSMSVQGHFGAYSHPRDDFADRYTDVEIMAHEHVPEFDVASVDTDGPEYWLWGYVPVSVVADVIEAHGGLAK